MDTSTSTDPAPDAAQSDDWSGDEWIAVLRCLRRIVPYVDVEDLDRTAAIQDEADLDSLDFMHLMAAIGEETGVVIPDADYPLVSTLAGLAAYVARGSPGVTSTGRELPIPLVASHDTVRRPEDGCVGGSEVCVSSRTNMAVEAVDCHGHGPRSDVEAMRWVGADGTCVSMTFGQLAAASDRFADVLRSLGVAEGERVYLLTGPCPEGSVAVLGTLKAGCIAAPVFATLGPEAIRQRMVDGDARVLVTTTAVYRRRIEDIRPQLTGLRHVLIVDADPEDQLPTGGLRVSDAMAAAPRHTRPAETSAQTPALLLYTSGTSGPAKGVVHGHGAIVSQHATAMAVLDLRPDDVFWCSADPGWVTGISYGLFAPLSIGTTTVVAVGNFDATIWLQFLAAQHVTVWYTSPTVLRLLRRLGDDAIASADLTSLRRIATVGEPLTAELATWAATALAVEVCDTWWQTETGAIMLASSPDERTPAGSIGRPVEGVTAAVLALGPGGRAAVTDRHVDEVTTGEIGELALRAGWPSMFHGYWNDPVRSAACFVDGWYLSGDLVRRDASGHFWYIGRADEVITSCGHRIGPGEIEAVLLNHPAVVDAAVVGEPDDVAGSIVVAHVSLAAGVMGDDPLRAELLGLCRRQLGPSLTPRILSFHAQLQRTDSGKIIRRNYHP